jgi:hypothetical protein
MYLYLPQTVLLDLKTNLAIVRICHNYVIVIYVMIYVTIQLIIPYYILLYLLYLHFRNPPIYIYIYIYTYVYI